MNFERLESYLDNLNSIVPAPFCDIRVMYKGKPCYAHASGERAELEDYKSHNKFNFYSLTKVVIAVSMMQLYEQGKFTLDMPVKEILPSIGEMTINKNGKIKPNETDITFRHLLTMTGGFTNTNLDKSAPDVDKLNTRQYADALAKHPLMFTPGTRYYYCYGFNVLGAVIEILSGMKLSDYIQKNIFDVCGITEDEISFYKEGLENKVASQKVLVDGKLIDVERRHFEFLSPYIQSGSGGLIGTADGYAKFVAKLSLNDGSLLKPETIDLMRTPQLNERCLADFQQRMKKIGYSYGLGVRTLIDKSQGAKSPIGEFGWDGAAGCYALVDTENQLAIFFGTQVLQNDDIYDIAHPQIRNLVYEALEL